VAFVSFATTDAASRAMHVLDRFDVCDGGSIATPCWIAY
jgi:hypothetical protein